MLWDNGDVACGLSLLDGNEMLFKVHSMIMWFYRSLCLLQTPAIKHSWFCLDLLFCAESVSLMVAVTLVSQAHFYILSRSKTLLVWESVTVSCCMQLKEGWSCMWYLVLEQALLSVWLFCVQGMFSCGEIQESDLPARLGIFSMIFA